MLRKRTYASIIGISLSLCAEPPIASLFFARRAEISRMH